MTNSTVFTSNRSQAVRLPKAVAFPEDVHQVDIFKVGHSRVIVPQGKRWDDLFIGGPRVSDDFISERAQPALEDRKSSDAHAAETACRAAALALNNAPVGG